MFDQETNKAEDMLGKSCEKACVDELFEFSSSIGKKYDGRWSNSTTFRISVSVLPDIYPEIGKLFVKVIGDIQNANGMSQSSTSTSKPIRGRWAILEPEEIISLANEVITVPADTQTDIL